MPKGGSFTTWSTIRISRCVARTGSRLPGTMRRAGSIPARRKIGSGSMPRASSARHTLSAGEMRAVAFAVGFEGSIYSLAARDKVLAGEASGEAYARPYLRAHLNASAAPRTSGPRREQAKMDDFLTP